MPILKTDWRGPCMRLTSRQLPTSKLPHENGQKYSREDIATGAVFRAISPKAFNIIRMKLWMQLPSRRTVENWLRDFKIKEGLQNILKRRPEKFSYLSTRCPWKKDGSMTRYIIMYLWIICVKVGKSEIMDSQCHFSFLFLSFFGVIYLPHSTILPDKMKPTNSSINVRGESRTETPTRERVI